MNIIQLILFEIYLNYTYLVYLVIISDVKTIYKINLPIILLALQHFQIKDLHKL